MTRAQGEKQMHIRVKLMGALRTKLQADAKGGVAELELPNGVTLAAALEQLGIPAGHVHLVMVNGQQELDRSRVLAEGDEVTAFPPVAGG